MTGRGRRVFYGWRIVGAGFGLEVLIGALLFHAYGAYVVLMREEFGWSRTLFSAVFAMARAESAVLGPVQGWLTDRFGPRALMRVGMTIFGLGFVLFSRIDSPLEFFGAFFLVAVGAGLGGYVPIAVAIVNWFKRRRALALGLASSGSAVGRAPDAGRGRLAHDAGLARDGAALGRPGPRGRPARGPGLPAPPGALRGVPRRPAARRHGAVLTQQRLGRRLG